MIESMENQVQVEQAPKPIFSAVSNMENQARMSFAQKLGDAGLLFVAERIANNQDPKPIQESISYLLSTSGLVVYAMKERLLSFFHLPKGSELPN